jgi:hypothetical protein
MTLKTLPLRLKFLVFGPFFLAIVGILTHSFTPSLLYAIGLLFYEMDTRAGHQEDALKNLITQGVWTTFAFFLFLIPFSFYAYIPLSVCTILFFSVITPFVSHHAVKPPHTKVWGFLYFFS